MVIINSFRYPESNIRHEQKSIRAVLDKKDLGVGTLFVSESALCWQQKDDIGFSISYQDISLHAISKDPNVYPTTCIYIIIDSHFEMPGRYPVQSIENSEDSDAESEPDVSELLLISEESARTSIIPVIYEAVKLCQELNPDPDDVEEEEDDNLYVDAEDEMEEGEYELNERGGGDADVNELSRRLQGNSVDINYTYSNGNDDEEFQDAD